ncbi:MAG TPA: glycosyltransferase family 39 protein [Thermoanaerobaculia bacterium]|nr:glycosyltransferase family 39 protein [Thermoanaerobaculia bacterium]
MNRSRSDRKARREAERQERKAGAASGKTSLRADWKWALGLTLLAWIHRIFFLRSNRDWSWPYTIFYEGDSETFYRYARSLLAGRLYDNGIPFHPPGFAWLLAGIHTLVGAGSPEDRVPYFAVKVVTALVGSLPVGLLYLLVKPYLGRTIALAASLLALYHFGLYVLAVAPLTEGTYLALLSLALLVWSRKMDHPLSAPGSAPGGWKAALALGILLGALALTRAEGVLIAAILVGAGLVGGLRRRRETGFAGLRPWALVAAGWILAVAPWAARNAIHLSEMNERLAGRLAEPLPTFVPLTIYGPLNLALANNREANGTFSRDFLASRAHSPVLDLTDREHLEFILHGDRLARKWILENPGDFARLVLRKWALFFSAWKLGWTQWNVPSGLTGTRWPVDVFLPNSPAALALSLPFTALGLLYSLAIPGAPRRWAVLVLLLTAAGMVTTGLFFGYARLGLLVLPFWLTWTATGLVWIAERLIHRERGWSRTLQDLSPSPTLLRALGGVAITLFLLEAWGATTDRNYRATGTNVPGQTYLDRDQPVVLEVIKEQ